LCLENLFFLIECAYAEQEADAEVERQRKERERQQKQDVMTLGETKMQIEQQEAKLAQLKEEKHQLFLQLKKVLNEDDSRRRQMIKER
jgi:G protein pathway suppressor 2